MQKWNCYFCQFGEGWDKYLEIWGWALVGKWELIGDVNNITFYTVFHDSTNILYRETLGLSVIERVYLISKKAKGNAHRYFKTMREGINLALYVWVVIEGVAFEVVEL